MSYSARTDYQDYEAGVDYEERRFSGIGGRYRRWSELRAVNAALDRIRDEVAILDCPCGIGRWWPTLARKASRIVAVDISEGMLRHARERAARTELQVELIEAEAESLPLPDGAVEWSFSFALTKHLPPQVQLTVLAELARVSAEGVISTFGLLTGVSAPIWRRRGLTGSYPLEPEQLEEIAAGAGLAIERRWLCTTPVGTERLVLLRRR